MPTAVIVKVALGLIFYAVAAFSMGYISASPRTPDIVAFWTTAIMATLFIGFFILGAVWRYFH